jgi:ubiquinone biosynthesis protein
VNRAIAFLTAARRHRLGVFLPQGSSKVLRWLLSSKETADSAPRGERLRSALESLGPVPIKFGQLLSTRRDLLPDEIADELALLQDNVAPFPSEAAVTIIEAQLKQPIATAFRDFDSTPLAAASVAQIHGVTLNDGEAAVIKVLRPGIEKQIAADIRLFKRLAWLVNWVSEDLRRLRLPEIVKDYEVTILAELDLRREAANASLLKKNTAQRKLVFVPTTFWDYSTPKLMVSERITGIPVGDIDALHNAGVNMKVLAERGVEIFFSQVFDDCFFHADMHPGNIFVDATNPDLPTYIAIDCAIVGQLSRGDQYYVARNLLAILQRNYRLVAELHIESGWVPPSTRVQDFESTIRMLCEPIFDRPLHQISLGHMLVNLFKAASSFDMKVQPQLVLLQKTLLNIEGLGRQLYPELNLWETAKPFLEDWLKRQYSPVNIVKQLQRDAPAFIHHASQLPEVIPQFLALQRQALNDTPSQRSSKVGADLFIGSGLTILIMSLALDLQSAGYVGLGILLLAAGILTRGK